MSYTPNFNDPRVTRKCNTVVRWVMANMTPEKEKELSRNRLDAIFGFSTTDIAKYLRETLLTCTNEKYKFGFHASTKQKQSKSKEYVRNEVGIKSLIDNLDDKRLHCLSANDSQLLKNKLTTLTTIANDLFDPLEDERKKYRKELESQSFAYYEKSGRLHNTFQGLPKDTRTALLTEANMLFEYDIECCAPTLIMQHAIKQNSKLKLPTIQHYLNNKTDVRNALATDLYIPIGDAKAIINALFYGARLNKAIAKIVKGDKAKVEWLRQDKFITDLKKDISKCWKAIKPSTGVASNVKLSGTIKSAVYFEQERKVLQVIIDHTTQTNNAVFLIHDGWTCAKQLCVSEMCESIKEQTGFVVKLDEVIHESSSFVSCAW